ncbi:ABC transporter permease [Hyphomonas sp.]|uniref:ABC transporter permease n=1 Tax=Hyphomonas sp. TaxID=87 RepID=UPI001BCC7227|nr:ABC transporter permease [Hyphomonas sp.]
MSQKPAPPAVHIRPERGAGVLNPLEIWKFRRLLRQMISRNFQTRVASSPMSLVWGFIRPGIMTLAFLFLRNVSGADFGTSVPYGLHIFTGLCLWFLFQDTAVQVAGSVATDSALSQKVYFPKVLSPIAMVLSRWIDLAVISAAVAIVQFAMGVPFSLHIVYLAPAMVTLLLLAFGLGVLFAGLMIYHPDYRKILETILYLGLFLSPVLFSKEILPTTVQEYYLVNPMVGILSAVRGAMFEPELIDFFAWLVAAGISVALSLAGLIVLSKAARNSAEKI